MTHGQKLADIIFPHNMDSTDNKKLAIAIDEVIHVLLNPQENTGKKLPEKEGNYIVIHAYGLKTRTWGYNEQYGYGCAECCNGDRCNEDCDAKYKGRRKDCPHCKGKGWIPKEDVDEEQSLKKDSVSRDDYNRLWENHQQALQKLDDMSKNNFTHFHVNDNSNGFRDWLDKKGVKWIANGHFTSIEVLNNDIFSLGAEFALYKEMKTKNLFTKGELYSLVNRFYGSDSNLEMSTLDNAITDLRK